MSWDHFKDSGCMNGFDNLSPEDKKRYKYTGEKYLGYDTNRLEERETLLYSSTGKRISEKEYLLRGIAETIKNGLDFDELDKEDLNTLSVYYGENYKEKFYSDYNLED